MTAYQKKVMKWTANYCDFFVTEDMKPLNDILIKNQVFYELKNDLTKLCSKLEKQIKTCGIEKFEKKAVIKPEFKSPDNIEK